MIAQAATSEMFARMTRRLLVARCTAYPWMAAAKIIAMPMKTLPMMMLSDVF